MAIIQKLQQQFLMKNISFGLDEDMINSGLDEDMINSSEVCWYKVTCPEGMMYTYKVPNANHTFLVLKRG